MGIGHQLQKLLLKDKLRVDSSRTGGHKGSPHIMNEAIILKRKLNLTRLIKHPRRVKGTKKMCGKEDHKPEGRKNQVTQAL